MGEKASHFCNANSVPRRHALPPTDSGMVETKRLGDFYDAARFLNDGFRFHTLMLQKTTLRVKRYVAKTIPAFFEKSRMLLMSDPQTIGTRIRTLREQSRLDQAVLAEAVGTARTHLTNIERGRAKPGRDLLLAIARYFNVSVDWLANGVGERCLVEPMTPKESLLLQAFRELPEHEADLHLQLIMTRTSPKRDS